MSSQSATPKTKYEIGEELLKQNRPDEYINIIEGLGKFSPELGEFLIEFVYGSVWARSYVDEAIISAKTRAIVTISCLASLGREPQLRSHIAGALKVGCSKEEIIEVLLHLAVYAGFPVTINAIKIAREVFESS
jgi:4-carboxymuconolactone decarboxylase